MDGQIFGTYLTMMSLGGFKFGIYTAAYQQLNRSTQYKWGEQEVFGGWDNLQYLGPGQDTQTLTGVIYGEWNGGFQQIDKLRALAAKGEPQLLISGTGRIMGYWVINQIDEGQEKFAAFGVPRRQEFTINLRKFGDSAGRFRFVGWFLQSVRKFIMALYRTKDGDTVDSIAYKYYGSTSNKLVENIFEANHRLSDYPPVLPEGLLIELPEQSQTTMITTKKVKLWD